MTTSLRVVLGEYDTAWHDPGTSLDRAASIVRAGAARGAGLVVLPEMCTTGFTMDPAQAEAIDGPSVRRLSGLAAANGVALLAGVAVREDGAAGGRAVNMALLFDAAGLRRAAYRKQRVFAYAGEDAVYSPGSEPMVTELAGVRLALFVCYDLRFPELFRAVARDTDVMVVIANWPAVRRSHWDALVRARAIENQCYVIAVNRTGHGGGIAYDGGSVAVDPWGELATTTDGGVAWGDVDTARVRTIRAEFPFLRDYRG